MAYPERRDGRGGRLGSESNYPRSATSRNRQRRSDQGRTSYYGKKTDQDKRYASDRVSRNQHSRTSTRTSSSSNTSVSPRINSRSDLRADRYQVNSSRRSSASYRDSNNNRTQQSARSTYTKDARYSGNKKPSNNAKYKENKDYLKYTNKQSGSIKSDPAQNKAVSVLQAIFRAICSIFIFIGKGIAHTMRWVWSKSKGLAVAIVALVLCAVLVLFDGVINAGRIYDGITIGDINVSKMTVEEATQAINDTYSERLASTEVLIFASEEDLDNLDVELQRKEQDSTAEQYSVRDALNSQKLWITDASVLDASIPAEKLAEEAYLIGRGGNFFDRISASTSGRDIPIVINYGEDQLGALIDQLDIALGDPVVECGIEIEDGEVSVTEGHDGYMVNKDEFTGKLDNAFLNTDGLQAKFVANVEFTEMVITKDIAERTKEAVTQAIADGASFSFEDQSESISSEELGTWIKTEPEKAGDKWFLNPYLDSQAALSSLVKVVNFNSDGISGISVKFEQTNSGLSVVPDSEVTVPDVDFAMNSLDETLFKSFRETGTQELTGSPFDIPIEIQTTDGPFSVDAALAYGVIEAFSEFTTEYYGTHATENRTHNIHLAADLINDSVVAADGGEWSFNDIAGNTDSAAGFMDANVMMGDELVEEAGGGVCQVATTVFNAVYEAGLPVLERHNHSLYSSTYPMGLDAAIAYPTLDLAWENDTTSDILLTTSYTENTVTVSLLGVNPRRHVETVKSEMIEGEKYSIKIEVDEYMAKDAYYKKTNGWDGSSISVTRTVTDENGDVLSERTFSSTYNPANEVIVCGPDSDFDAIRQKFQEERDSEEGTTSN